MKNYKKPTINENNMAKFETVYACSGDWLDDSSEGNKGHHGGHGGNKPGHGGHGGHKPGHGGFGC